MARALPCPCSRVLTHADARVRNEQVKLLVVQSRHEEVHHLHACMHMYRAGDVAARAWLVHGWLGRSAGCPGGQVDRRLGDRRAGRLWTAHAPALCPRARPAHTVLHRYKGVFGSAQLPVLLAPLPRQCVVCTAYAHARTCTNSSPDTLWSPFWSRKAIVSRASSRRSCVRACVHACMHACGTGGPCAWCIGSDGAGCEFACLARVPSRMQACGKAVNAAGSPSCALQGVSPAPGLAARVSVRTRPRVSQMRMVKGHVHVAVANGVHQGAIRLCARQQRLHARHLNHRATTPNAAV